MAKKKNDIKESEYLEKGSNGMPSIPENASLESKEVLKVDNFLQSIEFINWAGRGHEKIKLGLDQLITLSGPAGSGKTALFDALQAVFGLDREFYYSELAKSSEDGKKRNIDSYMGNDLKGGICTVVKNRSPYTSELLLPQHPEAEFVTLTCVFERKDVKSSVSLSRYITPGSQDLSYFMQEKSDHEGEELKRKSLLEKIGAVKYSKSEYLARLKELKLAPEQIRNLFMPQGMLEKIFVADSNKGGLVHKVLQVCGKEQVWDALEEALKKQFDAKKVLEELKKELKLKKSEQEHKELILNYHEAAVKAKNDIEANQNFADLAQAFEFLQKIKTLNAAVETHQNNQSNFRKKIQDLNGEMKTIISEFDDSEKDRKKLVAEKIELDRSLLHLYREIAGFKGSINTTEDMIKNLEKIEGDPEEIKLALAQVSNEKSDCFGKITTLEKSIQELGEEKRNLENYGVALPHRVAYFVNSLENAGIPREKMMLVCEGINVLNPKWSKAIEGILGGLRFNVLVDPAFLRIAEEMQVRHSFRHYVIPLPALASTGKRKFKNEKEGEGLLKFVELSSEIAGLEFVTRALRAEPIEKPEAARTFTERSGLRSITPEAQLFEQLQKGLVGSVSRSANETCCGERALKERKQEIESQLVEQRNQLSNLTRKKVALIDNEKKLQTTLSSLERKQMIPEFKKTIEDLKAKIEEVEPKANNLLDKIDVKQKEIDEKTEWMDKALSSRKTELFHEIQDIESQLKNIDPVLHMAKTELEKVERKFNAIAVKYAWEEPHIDSMNKSIEKKNRGELVEEIPSLPAEEYLSLLDQAKGTLAAIPEQYRNADVSMLNAEKLKMNLLNTEINSLEVRTEAKMAELETMMTAIIDEQRKFKKIANETIAAFEINFIKMLAIIDPTFQAVFDKTPPKNAAEGSYPFGYLRIGVGIHGNKPDLNNVNTSGGTGTMACIAFALAGIGTQEHMEGKFPFIFIDEPFKGIDGERSDNLIKAFLELLKAIQSQLIIITHDKEPMALAVADRVLVFRPGVCMDNSSYNGRYLPIQTISSSDLAIETTRLRFKNGGYFSGDFTPAESMPANNTLASK